jgi:hypothetical protein
LTVIANAPNPAGQALLGFFDGPVSPLALLAGALMPTLIAAFVSRALRPRVMPVSDQPVR